MYQVPIITSLYAGLLAFMLIGLTIFVIQGRWQHKVGVGHGGKEDLVKRIRMHGNFTEYVPMLLLIMALLEINGMIVWMLHTYGIALITSRIAHAYALYSSVGPTLARGVSITLTLLLLLVGGIACIMRYFF